MRYVIKVKRKGRKMSATSEELGKGYTVEERISRVENWINAHDKSEQEAAEGMERMGFHKCSTIEQELEAGMLPKSAEYLEAAQEDIIPIEQEIEAGLYVSLGEDGKQVWITRDSAKLCTHIYLPEDKYEEYIKIIHGRGGGRLPSEAYSYSFHDIPVISAKIWDIHYCTD